jgi:hypothetical protein
VLALRSFPLGIASVMNRPLPTTAFFGHHKCATKYILSILRPLARDCGLRLSVFSHETQFNDDLPGCLNSRRTDVLAYVNAKWNHVRTLDDYRGFHVIRDPRDILVSAYFSHLYSHDTRHWPELGDRRRLLQSVNKEKGLALEMDYCAPVFAALRDWNYDDERILELRFERLVTDPYQSFLRIFEHLGWLRDDVTTTSRLVYSFRAMIHRVCRLRGQPFPFRWPMRWVPATRVLTAVHENRFSRRSRGRQPGEEDHRHHYRKGVPGDWKNHLSPEHLREFQRRYGGVLEITGYDKVLTAAA